jgi:hypothetical protein
MGRTECHLPQDWADECFNRRPVMLIVLFQYLFAAPGTDWCWKFLMNEWMLSIGGCTAIKALHGAHNVSSLQCTCQHYLALSDSDRLFKREWPTPIQITYKLFQSHFFFVPSLCGVFFTEEPIKGKLPWK